MRRKPEQLDAFGFKARWLADKNREAADAARVAYNFPPSVREDRVNYYLAEAAQWDAIADQAQHGETNCGGCD
ncbi:hypothetical protein [uncultured Stenotrophomonas sp.]|uniref:hypothetical protein n=1 Tax=uncultured Stenotrophomonas sp. TaxID=165438 RepID=UPI0025D5187B|nr:hypothetical protein [uncultured Stenotrophomonas sp.]